MSELLATVELNPSPATLMLFYDEDSATVFATGKVCQINSLLAVFCLLLSVISANTVLKRQRDTVERDYFGEDVPCIHFAIRLILILSGVKKKERR